MGEEKNKESNGREEKTFVFHSQVSERERASKYKLKRIRMKIITQ